MGGTFVLGAKLGLRYDAPAHESGALALELNFAWYDTVDVDDPTGAKIAELDIWSVTLRPKFYMVVGPDRRFGYYLYLGFGYMEADRKITAGSSSGMEDDESGFVFEVGLGLEVSIADHVSVFIETGAVEPTGPLHDLSLWTVGGGIVFRF
ncbi:MAG: outer membrane beta-barrel protein [Deltaproteobacteria bacterium]|nr:outer membrane beta-barrel protein [Deltaproteobacteria bacterium]